MAVRTQPMASEAIIDSSAKLTQKDIRYFSLGVKVSAATSPLYTFTPSAALNLTDKFLIQPLLVNGAADTKANGGYRIYMETDASNYGYWYVGGSENTEKWINRQKNHSKEFWSELDKYVGSAKELDKKLKKHRLGLVAV